MSNSAAISWSRQKTLMKRSRLRRESLRLGKAPSKCGRLLSGRQRQRRKAPIVHEIGRWFSLQIDIFLVTTYSLGGAPLTETHRLSVDRIAQAAGVIDPVFLNSPQFRVEALERMLDCRLVVKVETLNPIRSFKGRGAEYLVATLNDRPHLVCA